MFFLPKNDKIGFTIIRQVRVIKAHKMGTVTKVPHKIGDFVTKGTALVEFANEE